MKEKIEYFEELKGHIITNVYGAESEDELFFEIDGEYIYVMHHHQDCCETVFLADICGSFTDIIGHVILKAEEVVDKEDAEWGSLTYTFYNITTFYGTVVLRWNGESNGYYSESVDFEFYEVKNEDW